MPRSSADRPAGARSGRRYGLDVVIVCLLVAVAAAVAAGFAWTRPTTAAGSLPYRQVGQLSYAAPARSDSVYGPAGLSTGQPIYTDIVGAVRVTYDYRFSTSVATHLSGTEQLVANLSNGQGITRTVPLQPPTPFLGDHFSTTGTLRLAALEAVAKSFASATGDAGVGSYAVDIAPHVAINGDLGSLPLKTTFNPSTPFLLTATTLSPTSISQGTASAPAPLHQFRSASIGSLLRPEARSNRLLGLPVRTVRFGALAIFVVAAIALVLLGRPILEDVTSDDERVRVESRYGTSLVQIQALPSLPVVELGSFTGLSQVARKLECPILHLQGAGEVSYAVVDNGTLYRYRFTSGHGASQNGRVPVHASQQ